MVSWGRRAGLAAVGAGAAAVAMSTGSVTDPEATQLAWWAGVTGISIMLAVAVAALILPQRSLLGRWFFWQR